ncbi:isoprenylcysteine carboxylmethyltransferase family protein [Gammaproteobacteria bacterium]|nr:isoprenylcysteine carboxylmethyltransferase family protein [Gammaproteobacteria bacterium]
MTTIPWWGRLPPLLVTLICMVISSLLARLPGFHFSVSLVWVGLIAVIGIASCIAALWRFRAASTTVHPMQPEQASALVVSGIFHYTRNPMYLGMALLTLAWVLFGGAVIAMLAVALLVWHLNRYQIPREEAAMLENFGEQYIVYKKHVRRWIGRY